MPERRWPRWVYGSGVEPDYRFSFANERTFLAWIRTALALVAAAVALDVVQLDVSPILRRVLGIVLSTGGLLAAAAAWARWALAERAVRHGRPLPPLGFGLVLALLLVGVGLTVIVTTVST